MDNQGVDTNNGSSQTQKPASKEWASGLTDQRNYLTVAFVWQIPKLSGGNAAARAVLNGWGLNSIYQYISGSPLWINQSEDGENNGNQIRAPRPRPWSVYAPPQQNDRRVVQYRRLHRGHCPLRQHAPEPDFRVKNDPLTLAVKRVFPLPFEGQQLEFRLEAFNALNHPQFAAPGTSQGAGNFGEITSTTTDNRDLQLVLKYIF